MIWNYKLTTNTIWLSFDYGKVVANSMEEAREKALIQLKSDLCKVNEALQDNDVTNGFTIDLDFTQLEVEPEN